MLGVASLSSAADSTPDDTVITPYWLHADVNDPNPDDNLRFSVGGYDLHNFQSHGIYQQDPNTNEIVFKATGMFGFETNMYTTAEVGSVFPEINPNARQSYKFLSIKYFNPWPFVSSTPSYYSTFSSVDLGSKFNPQRYDQQVPITVGLNPSFANFGGRSINGIEIESNDYNYHVKHVEIAGIKDGDCGDYEDNYTNSNTKKVEIKTQKLTQDSPDRDVLNLVTNANLGVELTDNQREITKQNSLEDTTPKGQVFSNRELGDFTFNDHVLLRPEVTITKQSVQVTDMAFEFCHFYKTSTIYWGPRTYKTPNYDTPDLIKSVHVNNRYIHKDYKVQIDFLCSVKLDAETYETALNDPYFKQNDWMWDAETGGTQELTFVTTKSGLAKIGEAIGNAIGGFIGSLFGGMLSWLWPIIILVVAVVVLYFIAKAYFLKKGKERINLS
jgi:hypothetical protein